MGRFARAALAAQDQQAVARRGDHVEHRLGRLADVGGAELFETLFVEVV
jgi:hypothetical protein